MISVKFYLKVNRCLTYQMA